MWHCCIVTLLHCEIYNSVNVQVTLSLWRLASDSKNYLLQPCRLYHALIFKYWIIRHRCILNFKLKTQYLYKLIDRILLAVRCTATAATVNLSLCFLSCFFKAMVKYTEYLKKSQPSWNKKNVWFHFLRKRILIRKCRSRSGLLSSNWAIERKRRISTNYEDPFPQIVRLYPEPQLGYLIKSESVPKSYTNRSKL